MKQTRIVVKAWSGYEHVRFVPEGHTILELPEARFYQLPKRAQELLHARGRGVIMARGLWFQLDPAAVAELERLEKLETARSLPEGDRSG